MAPLRIQRPSGAHGRDAHAHARAPQSPPHAVVLGWQQTAGNAAVTSFLREARQHDSPRLQRAVVVVSGAYDGKRGSGTVGSTGTNRRRDVQILIDRLHQVATLSNDEYGAIYGAIPNVQPEARVPPENLTRLFPVIDRIEAREPTGIDPLVARAQLGVELQGAVGPGWANRPADVELVMLALRYEGLLVDANPQLDDVLRGLTEWRHRIMVGTRGLGPRLSPQLVAQLKTAGAGTDEAATQLRQATNRVDQATLLQWPTVLADAATPADTKDKIYAQIQDNRARIPDEVKNRLAEVHRDKPEQARNLQSYYRHGMQYTRNTDQMAAAEPAPDFDRLETAPEHAGGPEGGLTRADVNRLVWDELRTEGSAGSINTYDPQYVTIGRGMGVGTSQGRDVLRILMDEDAAFRAGMLHVGVAMQGRTVLVVDPASRRVLRDEDALARLALERSVLGQYAVMAESPQHMQAAVDAQWRVIRQNAGDVPEPVFRGGTHAGRRIQPWSPEAIQFGAHLNHFASGITWDVMIQNCTDADGRGDIERLARRALSVANPRTAHGTSTFYPDERWRILHWAHEAFGAIVRRAPVVQAIADDNRFYFPAYEQLRDQAHPDQGPFRAVTLRALR